MIGFQSVRFSPNFPKAKQSNNLVKVLAPNRLSTLKTTKKAVAAAHSDRQVKDYTVGEVPPEKVCVFVSKYNNSRPSAKGPRAATTPPTSIDVRMVLEPSGLSRLATPSACHCISGQKQSELLGYLGT